MLLDVIYFWCYIKDMSRVQLWGYKCERCGHEWLPREKGQEPTVCPKCKSPYWDIPRRSDKISKERIKRGQNV